VKRRAYPSLKLDIEDFVKETNERLEAVLKLSLTDVVENALQPVSRGGRMRVATGFLRNSVAGSKGSWPSGEGDRQTDERFAYDDGNKPIPASVTQVISTLKIGETIYIGWTARYAAKRELYDGFLEGALQHWPRIVAFNTKKLKDEIGV
jgi:hypothetical protein